jgi:DMSO/TMAO reductase YedYZ molybdopterin-dependent catalytic subunit
MDMDTHAIPHKQGQRMMLPPGQRAVNGFPRFGTHLHRPPPRLPANPVIKICGAVATPFDLPLTELTALPRRELVADFHCVAGWSATDLRWEGVPFEAFYRGIIQELHPARSISHIVFGGLDRYRSIVTIEDAFAEDVLIAERLNDRPLDHDHGAPARIVSPGQYGFVSTKHLSSIELHTSEPPESYRHSSPKNQMALRLLGPHPRARVWKEERHRYLPAWSVRPVFRLLIPPFAFLSARGSDRTRKPPTDPDPRDTRKGPRG